MASRTPASIATLWPEAAVRMVAPVIVAELMVAEVSVEEVMVLALMFPSNVAVPATSRATLTVPPEYSLSP